MQIDLHRNRILSLMYGVQYLCYYINTLKVTKEWRSSYFLTVTNPTLIVANTPRDEQQTQPLTLTILIATSMHCYQLNVVKAVLWLMCHRDRRHLRHRRRPPLLGFLLFIIVLRRFFLVRLLFWTANILGRGYGTACCWRRT